VFDAEPVVQQQPQSIALQLGIVQRTLFRDDYVSGEGGNVRSEIPKMHMVHGINSRVVSELPLDVDHTHTPRRPLEKNMGRLSQQVPS